MTLKDELNGENGSFLLDLRTKFIWNHNAFSNLLVNLFEECQRTKADAYLDREISSGIWYLSTVVKDWVENRDSPKIFSQAYHKRAYELLNDLIWTYFMVDSPFNSNFSLFEKEIEVLENLT